MHLLRAVSSALDLESVPGLRAMGHLPPDERQALAQERQSAADLVSARIAQLSERIARKDELLQGYENDLAKLR